MNEEGFSTVDIAKKCECSVTTILEWLDMIVVPRRSSRETAMLARKLELGGKYQRELIKRRDGAIRARKAQPGVNPDGINTGNPLDVTECPITAEELIEMYCSGYSTIDMADHFGKTPGCIMKWLTALGTARRSRGEANVIMHALNINGKADRAYLRGRNSWLKWYVSRPDVNPDGINAGTELEDTRCPVSAEKLREMYVVDALTTYDIQKRFRDLGVGVTIHCISSWLKRIGVPIRGNSTRQKVAHRRKKEVARGD